MAPEIINNTSGYSYYVDLWSIGVCLYEFLGNIYIFNKIFINNIKKQLKDFLIMKILLVLMN